MRVNENKVSHYDSESLIDVAVPLVLIFYKNQ